MRKQIVLLFVMLALFVSTGCSRNVAVNDITEQKYPIGVSKYDAMNIITEVGLKRRWQINPVGSNLLEGTLYSRSHEVVVSIPLTDTSYSILYKDSMNMKYEDRTIHRNYNKWVETLRRDINIAMSSSTFSLANSLTPTKTYGDYLDDVATCEKSAISRYPQDTNINLNVNSNVSGMQRDPQLQREYLLRDYVSMCLRERGWKRTKSITQ